MIRLGLPGCVGIALVAAAAGCASDEVETVQLSGTIFDDRTDGAPLGAAALTVRGLVGEDISSTVADADGNFSAELWAGQVFNLTLEADGFVPTTFTGLAGLSDWTVADGVLWVRSEDAVAALQEEFAGCTRAGAGTGIIEGEIRLGESVNDSGMPLVTSGSAVAYEADGTPIQACYLDDDGVSAPDADQTGQTGRFAILGVPEGPITLDFTWVYTDSGDATWTRYYVWLPEGSIAPMYPVFVNFVG